MPWVEMPACKMVYPSVGALATNALAMVPLAPALLSTMMVVPSSLPSKSDMDRATKSDAPAGGTVTTTRTGLSGYLPAGPCAPACAPANKAITIPSLHKYNIQHPFKK